MSDKTRHLSNTALRRGLFSKTETAAAQPHSSQEISTSTDEQMLLFGEVAAVPLEKADDGRKLTRASE